MYPKSLNEITDGAAKARMAIERRIVKRAVKDLIEAGFTLSVYDGENESAKTSTDYKPIETPAFKAWFGGSKVVGPHGMPLRVYHATTRSFDEFNMDARPPERPGFTSFRHKALGAFFAADPEDAEPYAEGNGSRIMPVYLRLANPYKMTYEELFSVRAASQAKRMRHDIEILGHDGVWVSRNNPELDWWIAFRPDQIKSAIGNSGKFDPKSNSITDNRA